MLTTFSAGNIKLAGIPAFTHHPEIHHFISTHYGKQIPFGSLNLGYNSGEHLHKVKQNYGALFEALNMEPSQLVLPNQTHSGNVKIIDQSFIGLTADDKTTYLKDCDALVSSVKNVVIGVLTADCIPLLFFHPTKKLVAVAHAGWRGTHAEIGTHVIKAMHTKFGAQSKDVIVGIGPGISAQNYEVGEDLYQTFKETTPAKEMNQIFTYRNKKWHLNLALKNQMDLIRAGIPAQNIHLSNTCTYDSPIFYSYRKDKGCTGRFLSCIGLK